MRTVSPFAAALIAPWMVAWSAGTWRMAALAMLADPANMSNVNARILPDTDRMTTPTNELQTDGFSKLHGYL